MVTDPVGEFARQVRTDIADALDAVVTQKAADGVPD
ncbi:hypothetical protein CCUG60884_00269 [Mycobacteroides salmoniphilum]|uniref:Uncharacterized protein n=1 Tax=Mycobacteroides salmoniphilum TaxID=404941 RepID=A0A4R8SZP6_9MYCO|nr:hypothetical protein CCUG60884_00269 [Mycobacteroides salmoniphilum]